MATRSELLASAVSMTVTNLHSLASSATAGWSGAEIDNTTNLYVDAHVQVTLDPANTAPGSDAVFYLFFYGYQVTGDKPTTGAATGNSVGTEGALTFPSISTVRQSLPYVEIPYTAQDVVIKTPVYSVCDILGVRHLPAFWGVALLNYSGAALAASGNAVKWIGIKETIA